MIKHLAQVFSSKTLILHFLLKQKKIMMKKIELIFFNFTCNFNHRRVLLESVLVLPHRPPFCTRIHRHHQTCTIWADYPHLYRVKYISVKWLSQNSWVKVKFKFEDSTHDMFYVSMQSINSWILLNLEPVFDQFWSYLWMI